MLGRARHARPGVRLEARRPGAAASQPHRGAATRLRRRRRGSRESGSARRCRRPRPTSGWRPASTCPRRRRRPSRGSPPRRFPFVRQIDFADCGVAALAMVCRAFGRKVSLPFLRHVAGTGQDGTSLRGIMRAAEEAGLEGHAFKASKDRLDGLQLPAIIHWEGNHWIVAVRRRARSRAGGGPGPRPAAAQPCRGGREVERVVRDVPADAPAGRRSGRAPGSRVGASLRAADAMRKLALATADGDRGDGAPAARAGADAARGRRGGRRQLAPRVAADPRDRRPPVRRARESACCSGGCSRVRRCGSTGMRSISSPGACSSSRSSTSRRGAPPTSSAG